MVECFYSTFSIYSKIYLVSTKGLFEKLFLDIYRQSIYTVGDRYIDYLHKEGSLWRLISR